MCFTVALQHVDKHVLVTMQVRGKTVYLQYSTRQEIVHSKQPLDGPSNVLLVTMDNLDVSAVK